MLTALERQIPGGLGTTQGERPESVVILKIGLRRTSLTVHVGVRALTMVTNRNSDFDILRDVSGDLRVEDVSTHASCCNLHCFVRCNPENVGFIPLSRT